MLCLPTPIPYCVGNVSRPDYAAIRMQALELAEENASALIPPVDVRITDLDAVALRAYRETWTGRHPSGYGGFDWVYLWHRHCRQEVKSFRCAIWSGSMLCGMAIGTISKGHSHLTIRYVEGRPQGHPLRGHVARTALGAAEYYARALNLPQVRIENPAPALEAWYRHLGFGLAFKEGAVRYLAMSISNDPSENDPEALHN